jgi:putative membrane protein insertion efficiency factor
VKAGCQRLGRGALWLWDHTLGWVLMWGLLVVIKAYQVAISPLLPPSCRFHPSCSRYGFEAIRVHGSAKGLTLASWRLLRCNPWNKGGVDPVPATGRWLPDIHPDGSPRGESDGTQDSMQHWLPERRTT